VHARNRPLNPETRPRLFKMLPAAVVARTWWRRCEMWSGRATVRTDTPTFPGLRENKAAWEVVRRTIGRGER